MSLDVTHSGNLARPRPERRSVGGRGAALTVVLGALLLGVPVSSPAQETPEEPADEPLVTAPTQFWVGPVAGFLDWEPPRQGSEAVDEAAVAGLEVGTRLSRFLAFRFTVGFGQAERAGVDSVGVRRRADTNQWLVEVAMQPRLAVGPWAEAGVVPYGSLGAGGIVHDPRNLPEGARLLTRSQGYLTFGGGLTVEPDVLSPLGVRAEWWEADVQLQPIFRPRIREGDGRSVGGVRASVYVTF